jgi:ribosomal protein L11 methyltransferase
MEIDIPPRWRIVEPGASIAEQGTGTGGIPIVLEPGVGFGDGTHPTTVLCMQAIAALSPRQSSPWRMLDFGSGSGILSIGAAKLGAEVVGIEIDEQAIEHARDNAQLNSVSAHLRFARSLEPTDGQFELVVANILRRILLDFAPPLVERLGPSSTLVLSGLVSTDVPEVSARYASLLEGRRPEIYERGEWRALVWRAQSPRAR